MASHKLTKVRKKKPMEPIDPTKPPLQTKTADIIRRDSRVEFMTIAAQNPEQSIYAAI